MSARLLHRVERVALDEAVDERQGGRHAPGQRRVAGRDLQRVDPDDAVGDAVQALHRLGEVVRIAAVPAVGEDHDDGAAGHAAHAPLLVEAAQPVAEPGAARPVDDPLGRLAERHVGVARAELAGDAGEAGAEGERLDPPAPGDGCLDEPQQRPGVRLHRAADVEQQHEAAVARRRPPEVAVDRLALGAQRGADRAPQVGAGRAPRRRAHPQRAARRADEPHARHQPVGLGELGVVVGREVLVPQHLGGAEAQLDGRVVARRRGVGLVAVASSSSLSTASVIVIGSGFGLGVAGARRAPRTRGTRGRTARGPRGGARASPAPAQ